MEAGSEEDESVPSTPTQQGTDKRGSARRGSISDIIEEELAAGISPAPSDNPLSGAGYRNVQPADNGSDTILPSRTAPQRTGSDAGSAFSNPDDTPSVRVSNT
jgi:hypothetical protein